MGRNNLKMISDMTAKYFEARICEGQNFNYLGWFQGIQREKAKAKAAVAVVVAKEFVASETAPPTNNSERQDEEPRSHTSIPDVDYTAAKGAQPIGSKVLNRNSASSNQAAAGKGLSGVEQVSGDLRARRRLRVSGSCVRNS